MKVVGIIPSRYKSSRLPGKPLIDILGKSMIQRVYEQCQKCPLLSEVIVATDNEMIYKHVVGFKGKVIMTSEKHTSGTDRCNEVVQKLYANYDLIVNIQGDEPFINPEQITEVITLFNTPKIQIGTLAKRITEINIIQNKHCPKVTFTKNGLALNFFREITSFHKNKSYYKHIGIYAYKTKVLNKICKLLQSKNEKEKKLEQLRWLDNGYNIKVGITTFDSISIDTPEDIMQIKATMR